MNLPDKSSPLPRKRSGGNLIEPGSIAMADASCAFGAGCTDSVRPEEIVKDVDAEFQPVNWNALVNAVEKSPVVDIGRQE